MAPHELHNEAESFSPLTIENAPSESSKFQAALQGFMVSKSSELTQVPEWRRVIIVPACDYYPL